MFPFAPLVHTLFLGFMILALHDVLAAAQVPAGTGQAEPTFQVTADGAGVELHEFPGGVFGQVEVARPVTVEVRADCDIRWVDIRPRSAGIKPAIAPDHGSFRFQLDRPVPLTIEFNGQWERVIHLFGNPPEKDPPKPGTPNVRYFGPGVHEAGLIRLKKDETLYLAPGAWVKGVVGASRSRNVVIRGRGVLDGSGAASPRKYPRAPPPAVPEGQRAQPPARPYGTGNMIRLEGTQDALVEGITVINSPGWTVCVNGTTGTRIDGIRILNAGGDCDGIDLCSSVDVLVENVFIRTNDDNIAIKAIQDVHDITVRRAVLWNEGAGSPLEIGFELASAKVERIRYEDIDIIRAPRSAISIHNGDSATVQDISYRNIRVEDVRRKLISFAVVYGWHGSYRHATEQERSSNRMVRGGPWDGVFRCTPEQRAALAKNRGHIRDVRVTNLQVLESLPFSVVSGWDAEHAVEGVVIENMTHQGRKIRNASDARMSVDSASEVRFR